MPNAVRKRMRLAQQRTAAEITAPMPRQKTYRLGGDHASLDAGQRRLGFVKREADHLEPVVGLVEVENLVVADHGVVVADDAELELNTHGRSPGWVFQNPRRGKPASPQGPLRPSFWSATGLCCNPVCFPEHSKQIHVRLHRAGCR